MSVKNGRSWCDSLPSLSSPHSMLNNTEEIQTFSTQRRLCFYEFSASMGRVTGDVNGTLIFLDLCNGGAAEGSNGTTTIATNEGVGTGDDMEFSVLVDGGNGDLMIGKTPGVKNFGTPTLLRSPIDYWRRIQPDVSRIFAFSYIFDALFALTKLFLNPLQFVR